MRIISGNFKGKKIIQPKDLSTRPLKDLTKESIFNIIAHSKKINIKVENSIVLDLFSGVGSFGIECLSRGANYVFFLENYNGVLPVLKKNLDSLKNVTNYKIIEQDIYKNFNFLNLKKKFNIIFLDPPYKDKNFNYVLELIFEQDILEKNGVIIVHRHKNDPINLSKNFKIVEEKKYGISKIFFLNI